MKVWSLNILKVNQIYLKALMKNFISAIWSMWQFCASTALKCKSKAISTGIHMYMIKNRSSLIVCKVMNN